MRVLVVLAVSGLAFVWSDAADGDDGYPSFPSPDGVEFYDFERNSATHERYYGLTLPEGLTMSEVSQRCGLAEARGFASFESCIAEYIHDECWIIPNMEDRIVRTKGLSTAEEMGPYALEWICLDDRES